MWLYVLQKVLKRIFLYYAKTIKKIKMTDNKDRTQIATNKAEKQVILPVAFVNQMQNLMSSEECDALTHAITDTTCPVSIRINPMKWKKEELEKEDELGEQVPWCETGYYLPQRPSFTSDPLFHAGCYYVQEASSMFVEQIIKRYVSEPSVVLDLCAAPGGKSTLIHSCLPEGSLLVSNEPIRQRANILKENLIKWGYPNMVVTNNYAPDFQYLGAVFDMVVADVPCSGEGMFRKDSVAIDEWSESNVEMCQKRQREIVADIWSCLKPGGIMIYSTCTYNTKEDEENVDWICEELGGHCLPVDTDESWGITGNLLSNASFPCYHFFPHKTRGEGFFVAAILKDEDNECRPSNLKKEKKKSKTNAKATLDLKQYIQHADAYTLTEKDGVYNAFPQSYTSLLDMLQRKLSILHYGIEIGETKGKKFCPSHCLAMSTELLPKAFTRVGIDHATALAYLRRESIVLSPDVARGYVLLTHQGTPLGFANNLGARANNLYPEYWKIRQRD